MDARLKLLGGCRRALDGWELSARDRLEGDATPWHYARPVLAALRLLRELPRERTVGELSQRIEHVDRPSRGDRRRVCDERNLLRSSQILA
ncbi:hypothetical protein ACFWVF_18925 [Streptomyces sp. NPDC058659]|uniref:hypothetical protein n=1 Tax=Streptomyces sp. NPDC058659 TaxID=3346581 RepID=UPI003665F205